MHHINRPVRSMLLLSLISILIFPTTVMSHARWVVDSVTPPRTSDTQLKTGPCGNIARTSRSTIFSEGQTIDLEFEETVNHPGHYRIAFSPANDLDFDYYILADNIPDVGSNNTYTQQVTIPMQTCTACTLQLIQVMTTSTNPSPATDFYYSCADIQVTAFGDSTAPPPASGVMSQPGDGQVNVSWINPASDFYQVVVLKDINPIVDAPVNGTIYTTGDMINGAEVAYVGKNSAFTAINLANDLPYYFRIFAQNPRKNYAAGVETNATPTVTATGGGGTTPGNTSSPSNSSGGGSINILFWAMLLMVRLIAMRNRLTEINI